MTINERIKAVRKKNNLTQTEFAEKLSSTMSSISQIERGVLNPSRQMTDLISREFGINREWLETGEGEMESPKTKFEHIAKITATLMKEKPDSFKNRFIKALSELDSDEWVFLEEFINSLNEQKK